jgi:hypothetical protein
MSESWPGLLRSTQREFEGRREAAGSGAREGGKAERDILSGYWRCRTREEVH